MKLIIKKAQEILIPQWEWLLESLKSYVEANPAATQAEAATYIASLSSPFELATIQIVDAVGALQWFIIQTGASWSQVKQLLQNHPVKVIRNYDPDIGNTIGVPSEESKILRLTEDRFDSNWGDIDWPDDITLEEIRETTPGPTFNFVKERRWTGTLEGQSVTVRQLVDNQFDGTRVVSTPQAYEVV